MGKFISDIINNKEISLNQKSLWMTVCAAYCKVVANHFALNNNAAIFPELYNLLTALITNEKINYSILEGNSSIPDEFFWKVVELKDRIQPGNLEELHGELINLVTKLDSSLKSSESQMLDKKITIYNH